MHSETQPLNDDDQDVTLAASELLPLVYEELHRLAAAKLAGENKAQTLQATALVHEAYLRLVGSADRPRWANRSHFFAAAAEAMRRILVENARRKQRLRHGGGRSRISLDEDVFSIEAERVDELLDVNDALDRLATAEPHVAQLVKLHYFTGITLEEAAELLKIPVRTAYRRWNYARAWLFRTLKQGRSDDSAG